MQDLKPSSFDSLSYKRTARHSEVKLLPFGRERLKQQNKNNFPWILVLQKYTALLRPLKYTCREAHRILYKPHKMIKQPRSSRRNGGYFLSPHPQVDPPRHKMKAPQDKINSMASAPTHVANGGAATKAPKPLPSETPEQYHNAPPVHASGKSTFSHGHHPGVKHR